MRRYLLPIAGAAMLAAGVAAYFFVLPALGSGPSLDGNWKLGFSQPTGQEMSVWILQFETKDGERVAKVLSAVRDELRGASVVNMEATEKSLRFTLKVTQGGDNVEVPVTLYSPENERNPKLLRGTLTLSAQRVFAQMERTELKEIDSENANDESGMPLVMKAMRTRNPKDQEKLYAEVIESNAGKPLAYYGGLGLLSALMKQGKSTDDLRKPAEAALQVAASYGPEMKNVAVAQLARALITNEQSAPLAVEFARQAEKNLAKEDPPEAAVSVLKTLAGALRKTGKADEAKQFQPRIDKLEESLDTEYLKDAVPFKPRTYGGRAGTENRVVLVELFTGAQCPPCVAADVAFDALLQTYRPKDVVLLQYHLHVPGPDPLTNPDSEKRSKYYDVAGTPTFYLNGHEGPPALGSKLAARAAYYVLFSKIGDELKAETKTAIQLKAQRKGDKIAITANVTGLDTTGETVRLRLVVVEEMVRYQGSNGQRLHHQVVRSFPGGVDGVKLDKAESKHEQTVQVAELAKSLSDYLTASNEKRPFIDDERPLELKHLKIVAFIQNDVDKKVIQAVQADVEEAK
jgi:hypothetical protein